MSPDEILALLLFLLTGGCTIGIVLVVSAVTLVPFALLGWFLYTRSKRASAVRQVSQDWPSVTGEVIKSRVEVMGGERTTVRPRIVYKYTVDGQQYQGDQIRAGDKFWSVRRSQDAYKLIDHYPVGATVVVYYNPVDPAESALER
ncbi:MAG: DUF3592 domain-containing protein [Anaerolineae bacterium]|nr:DUF3592 domain-containing protein [Anaerolineae bacterium]